MKYNTYIAYTVMSSKLKSKLKFEINYLSRTSWTTYVHLMAPETTAYNYYTKDIIAHTT